MTSAPVIRMGFLPWRGGWGSGVSPREWGSALRRACREPGDEIALAEDGGEDDRDAHQRRRGHQPAPVDARVRDEVEQRDRQGLGGLVGEDHREDEVVPAEDAGEYPGGGGPGRRERQRDPQERPE